MRRVYVQYVFINIGSIPGGGWEFFSSSPPALGPTQPLIQWVPGALSAGVKQPGREVDHSIPSGAEVKVYVELYLHSTNTPSWRCAQLKYKYNFTFTFIYMFSW